MYYIPNNEHIIRIKLFQLSSFLTTNNNCPVLQTQVFKKIKYYENISKIAGGMSYFNNTESENICDFGDSSLSTSSPNNKSKK